MLLYYIMPNLSGSGGRSSGVNYATAKLFDRMYWSLQGNVPHVKRGAQLLSLTYQSTTGPSGGSLKRAYKYF
jgi:hypothetical protein